MANDPQHDPRQARRPGLRELRDKTEAALETMLGRPVYILFEAEVPVDLRPVGVRAFVGHWLGSILKAQLASRWHGHGGAMLICETDLIRYVRQSARARYTRCRVMAAREFLENVSHETSHLIVRGWLGTEPEPLPELTALATAMTAMLCVVDPVPLKELPVPWNRHGGNFIRVYLHLCWRLREAMGIRFGPTFDPKDYGLRSSRWRYEGALENEPERLAYLPLTEIAEIPPPDAFAELWAADVRAWFLRIENPTARQIDALVEGMKLFPTTTFTKGFAMTELLNTIGATFKGLRRKRTTDFRDLVRRIAEGEAVDADAAAELLDAAGKSPEDLAADVALYQRRVELRRVVDEAAGLDSEEAKLRKQAAAADRAWEAADKRHTETIFPLADRLEEIGVARAAARRAVDELRRTSRAELQDQLAKATAAIGEVATASTVDQLAARQCRENVRRLLRQREDLRRVETMTIPEPFGQIDVVRKRKEAEFTRLIVAEQTEADRLDGEVKKLEGQRRDLTDRRDAIVRMQEAP